MPYDPTYPAASTPPTSAPMRAQLQSIVDLIDTIPVGPAGPQGVPGVSVTGAVVDGVSSLIRASRRRRALRSMARWCISPSVSCGAMTGRRARPGELGSRVRSTQGIGR